MDVKQRLVDVCDMLYEVVKDLDVSVTMYDLDPYYEYTKEDFDNILMCGKDRNDKFKLEFRIVDKCYVEVIRKYSDGETSVRREIMIN